MASDVYWAVPEPNINVFLKLWVVDVTFTDMTEYLNRAVKSIGANGLQELAACSWFSVAVAGKPT